jgi:hypothetical protein
MRTRILGRLFFQIVMLCVLPTLGATQDRPTTDPLLALSPADAQFVERLRAIITHDASAAAGIDTGGVSAVIFDALTSGEPLVRELALAAVVSRAAGPAYSQDPVVMSNWALDRSPIQQLRPAVRAALADPDERVRHQAVAAVASLDFQPGGSLRIRDETVAALIHRFSIEPSHRVRAKIVGGFASDGLGPTDGL